MDIQHIFKNSRASNSIGNVHLIDTIPTLTKNSGDFRTFEKLTIACLEDIKKFEVQRNSRLKALFLDPKDESQLIRSYCEKGTEGDITYLLSDHSSFVQQLCLSGFNPYDSLAHVITLNGQHIMNMIKAHMDSCLRNEGYDVHIWRPR